MSPSFANLHRRPDYSPPSASTRPDVDSDEREEDEEAQPKDDDDEKKSDCDNELLSPSPPTRAEVDACVFSSWYHTYRSVTPRAEIIRPLPREFLQYLLADGIFLPGDVDDRRWELGSEDSGYAADSEEDWSVVAPSFPELEARITSITQTLGGSVFPKLNWSSPRDASWIATCGHVKCETPADVFLLLKSSDFIVHDLCHMYDACSDCPAQGDEDGAPQYELVLKKWYDVASSMEFRCFVRDGCLIAISQREMNYYDFLADSKEQIQSMIVDFFERSIVGSFPNSNYVVDVYITRDMSRVWLIDFNVFYHMTDALLFTWDEIMRLPSNGLDFRLIRSQLEAGRYARSGMAFSTNRYPKEVIDLSNGVTLAEFAANVTREMAHHAAADTNN